MTVICDISNIVRHYSDNGSYVENLSNGAVVVAPRTRDAAAFYCNNTNTFWTLRPAYAGQEKYVAYEVDTIPEGAEVGITRYNNGVLEIDEELKKAADDEKTAAEDAANVEDQILLAVKMYAESLTSETLMCDLADIYDKWAPGVTYSAGKIISYGKDQNGDTQLYKVVEPGHTSQADWLPDRTPALYTPIGLNDQGIPIWKQPTGAHDAYNIGDQCEHKGYIWTSKINGNTQEPGSDPRWWEQGAAS